MSEESAWGHLLDIFSARAQTSDYLPGDEVAYSRCCRAHSLFFDLHLMIICSSFGDQVLLSLTPLLFSYISSYSISSSSISFSYISSSSIISSSSSSSSFSYSYSSHSYFSFTSSSLLHLLILILLILFLHILLLHLLPLLLLPFFIFFVVMPYAVLNSRSSAQHLVITLRMSPQKRHLHPIRSTESSHTAQTNQFDRALKGCSVLGRWQHSLEILADLLSEKEKPDPTSFELTLEALASHDQVGLPRINRIICICECWPHE